MTRNSFFTQFTRGLTVINCCIKGFWRLFDCPMQNGQSYSAVIITLQLEHYKQSLLVNKRLYYTHNVSFCSHSPEGMNSLVYFSVVPWRYPKVPLGLQLFLRRYSYCILLSFYPTTAVVFTVFPARNSLKVSKVEYDLPAKLYLRRQSMHIAFPCSFTRSNFQCIILSPSTKIR